MTVIGPNRATPAEHGVSALVAPLDGRFLIWRGASGRAYAFSPAEDDGSLDEAVLIDVRRDRSGRPIDARPVAEIDDRRGEVWAHHLATTPAARRAATVDLLTGGRSPEVFGG